MKTKHFKIALMYINFCGVILIIFGNENANLFRAIIQIASGFLLILIALKLAW